MTTPIDEIREAHPCPSCGKLCDCPAPTFAGFRPSDCWHRCETQVSQRNAAAQEKTIAEYVALIEEQDRRLEALEQVARDAAAFEARVAELWASEAMAGLNGMAYAHGFRWPADFDWVTQRAALRKSLAAAEVTNG